MAKQQVRPVATYLMVWMALLVLTIITVTVAALKLGQFSVMTAIAVATVKSALVVLFFMHIKYEDMVFKIMLGIAISTLTIILVLTFVDVIYR